MKKLITIALVLLTLPSSAWSQEAKKPTETLPTVEQLTKVLDDLYRSTSSHATMKMKVVNDRGTRELSMESWSKGEDLSLFVIRKPSREAGTATLKTDEGLWNYAPRADRLIRIPTGMLSDAWMGSHFTNDDLVRETSYADDYKTEMSWADLNGQKVIKATFLPRPDAPVIYTKIEFFCRVSDYVALRADYYDGKKLMRRMEFKDIREVDGKPVPHVMEILPMDKKKKGESTTITYEKLTFDLKVDDKIFTKRGLRRVAKKR